MPGMWPPVGARNQTNTMTEQERIKEERECDDRVAAAKQLRIWREAKNSVDKMEDIPLFGPVVPRRKTDQLTRRKSQRTIW